MSLQREFVWKYANPQGHTTKYWPSMFPIINSNTATTGTKEMATAFSKENCFSCLHKFVHSTTFKDHEYSTFLTVGKDYSKLPRHSNYIHLDYANGYIQDFLDNISFLRDKYPYSVIMAGTVVTPDRAVEVINAGADIVKVGLGSGSVCRTSSVTGVGYPQLSAIMECSLSVHSVGGYLCSDGGIKEIGDIAKSFGAGADIVMLGGLLAGTDECHEPNYYYGMSSDLAREKWEHKDKGYRASEGTVIATPRKGRVAETIKEIQGGIRSTLSYTGHKTLESFVGNAEFIYV